MSAALPRALGALHDVRVLIPGYAQVLRSGHAIRVVGSLSAQAEVPACRIGRMDMPDGLIIYVLICPELYEREGNPYGDGHGNDWPDNPVRFARLCLAGAEIAAGTACIRWTPELVHAHDWPTGLTPAYMHWRGLRTPSVFTIHNLAYQGNIDMSLRRSLALPHEACGVERMEFYGKLSLLKAGIAYASHVTTVSATYAQEITTEEFGCGMEGVSANMKARQGLLRAACSAASIRKRWVPRAIPTWCLAVLQLLCDWAGQGAPRRLCAPGVRRSRRTPVRCLPWCHVWCSRMCIDENTRERIPDPNAIATFDASRPDFGARQEPGHAEWHALYNQLLDIRRREIVPRLPGARFLDARVLGDAAVLVHWRLGDGCRLRLELNLGEQVAALSEAAPGAELLFASRETVDARDALAPRLARLYLEKDHE
ncbi:Glycogen synthase [Stutzerimonas stutzeri]